MDMKAHSICLENMPVSSSIICQTFTRKSVGLWGLQHKHIPAVHLFIQFINCAVSHHTYCLSGDLTRALRSFAGFLVLSEQLPAQLGSGDADTFSRPNDGQATSPWKKLWLEDFLPPGDLVIYFPVAC